MLKLLFKKFSALIKKCIIYQIILLQGQGRQYAVLYWAGSEFCNSDVIRNPNQTSQREQRLKQRLEQALFSSL